MRMHGELRVNTWSMQGISVIIFHTLIYLAYTINTEMTNYQPIEKKATEAVTLRLTKHEKNTLIHLAEIGKESMTDVVRSLLSDRANALGIDKIPEPQKKRRPGRPRIKSLPQVNPLATARPEAIHRSVITVKPYDILNPAPSTPSVPPVPKKTPEPSFGVLVASFREYFSHRAEGTRRELEETIEFLCGGNTPLLPQDIPLRLLTSSRLQRLREDMRVLEEVRVAKKNLHLTYLRMMLHWAVKQPNIALNLNPALDLKPFTILETKGGWYGGR